MSRRRKASPSSGARVTDGGRLPSDGTPPLEGEQLLNGTPPAPATRATRPRVGKAGKPPGLRVRFSAFPQLRATLPATLGPFRGRVAREAPKPCRVAVFPVALRRWLLVVGLAVALLGCADFSARPAAAPPAIEGQDLTFRARPLRASRSGGARWGRCEASWYGEALRGRSTASGEVFDPDELTAAHRTIAFGTVVEVELLDADGAPTGTAVAVRITDRGPYPDGRCLDLTSAAFAHLAPLRTGVVEVRYRRRAG